MTESLGTYFPYQQQQQPNSSGYGSLNGSFPGAFDEGYPSAPASAAVPIVLCPREVLSSTLGVVPSTPELLKSCSLPFGLIMTPLGLPFSEDTAGTAGDGADVPFVPYDKQRSGSGGGGIVRCKKCRGYVNPYVEWRADGTEWLCNLCGTTNATPAGYLCRLNPATGQREDVAERPELRYCCVDMEAPPGKYVMRPPMPPTYTFFVDVSRAAVTSGLVNVAAAGIRKWVERRTADHANSSSSATTDRVRVAIIAFDTQTYIFTFPAGKPRLAVVPDPEFVHDAPPVFPDSAFLSLGEPGATATFLALLDKLPGMFAATSSAEDRALARAIYAVGHVCGAAGGRLVVFLGGAPGTPGVTGNGAIKARQASPSASVADEFRRSQPLHSGGAGDYYKSLGQKLSRKQFAVDVVVSAPGAHAEVGTLAALARQTGGAVLARSGINADDVAGLIYGGGAHGWETIMRTRCSQNLLADDHYGCIARGAEVYGFPALGPGNSCCATVRMDSACTGRAAYVQTALVFTSETQRRVVRIATLELPVSGTPADVFAHANAPETAAYFAKLSAHHLVTAKSAADLRSTLVDALYRALLAYRRLATVAVAPRPELAVPEALDALPLYILGTTKAPLFQERMRPDFRAAAAVAFQRLPMAALLAAVHPQLFDIGGLTEGTLPPLRALTADSVAADSLALFHTGNGAALLFVGKEVPRDRMLALFGTARLADVEGMRRLPVLEESPYNRAVRWLIDTLAAGNGFPHLEVTSNDRILDLLLVDEHSHSTFGYLEFVSYLHNKIEKHK